MGPKGPICSWSDINRFPAAYPEDFLDFVALFRRPGVGRGLLRLVLTARSTLDAAMELALVSVFGRKRSYLARRYYSLSTFRIRTRKANNRDNADAADKAGWDYVRFFAKPAQRIRREARPELDGGHTLDRELRWRVKPSERRTMELYLVRDCGVPGNRLIDPRHTWPPFRKELLGCWN